jgi:hypothetical protein
MKKIYTSILSLMSVFGTVFAQTVIPPQNEIILPRYANFGSDATARIHVATRLRLTGLTPSTNFRYIVGVSNRADLNTTPLGVGLMVNIRNILTEFGHITGTAASKAIGGQLLTGDIMAINATTYYGQFASDADGNYEGWFAVLPNAINNANHQLTVGGEVYFYVHINNGSNFVVSQSFRTTNTIKLLEYSQTPNDPNGCTVLMGSSTVGNEKMVSLFDNESFSGRPLYTTWTENDGMDQQSTTPYSSWYSGVDATQGSWGAVIPNNLPGGVKAIRFYEIDGTPITLSNAPAPNSSTDGTWNGVSTANPQGGLASPIFINSISGSGSLPVTLLHFRGEAAKEGVRLHWETSQEINNKHFELNRAGEDGVFRNIGRVSAVALPALTNRYQFVDPNPIAGMNYYQLRQFDLDGRATTFKTIAVRFGGSLNAIRMIHSSNAELEVMVSVAESKKGNIVYTDMVGNVLYNQATTLREGENVIRIPVSAQRAKMAVVSFVSNGERMNLKVLR